MTVFEFISAQAPRTTQGLLIGLWYATFSIRYLVVGILNNLIIEKRSWLIYEGVKGFLILVSLVLFSCVSRRYRYRQRDEIVNVQGMIEDTHERWLDQEEEYMQEQRLFYQTTRSYDTIPVSWIVTLSNSSWCISSSVCFSVLTDCVPVCVLDFWSRCTIILILKVFCAQNYNTFKCLCILW